MLSFFTKVRFFNLLVMALLTLVSAAFAQQEEAATPLTVIVFGDSITAGNMLPTDQRSQVWVNVVENQSGGKLKLVNEGKGGRPTDSVAEFKDMLVRHARVDRLVIALGTNDSRNIKDDCVPDAVKNLQDMVALARTSHVAIPILIVGPPNIRKDALGPTQSIANQREAKLQELGDAFAALASQNGCDFVSLYGVVPEASLTKDGVHPDVAGNEAIAQVILAKLLPATK